MKVKFSEDTSRRLSRASNAMRNVLGIAGPTNYRLFVAHGEALQDEGLDLAGLSARLEMPVLFFGFDLEEIESGPRTVSLFVPQTETVRMYGNCTPWSPLHGPGVLLVGQTGEHGHLARDGLGGLAFAEGAPDFNKAGRDRALSRYREALRSPRSIPNDFTLTAETGDVGRAVSLIEGRNLIDFRKLVLKSPPVPPLAA